MIIDYWTQVKTMSNSECVESYSYNFPEITDNMICAAAPGKDACQGDSGGTDLTNNTSDKNYLSFSMRDARSQGKGQWGIASPP